MKKLIIFSLTIISSFLLSQKFTIDTLLTDKISIRAIQLWDRKVWYAGTDSKFGYVNLKDKSDKKQIKLSDKNLQFRTLGQSEKDFYAINIESPAYFFKIKKRNLKYTITNNDTLKTAFYDALIIVDNRLGYAFSDPDRNNQMKLARLKLFDNSQWKFEDFNDNLVLYNGEAAFAASNSNFSYKGDYLWLATGGNKSRIYRFSKNHPEASFEVFETPFTQGTSSQGIYSIDFYDKNFGIAVGGDYTKQSDNTNNIATTNDGGQTWQIQASGQNAGYMTCVKFRPKTKGKEIVAVGDQHISFSSDYGKTWTKISDEKNLYACEWLNHDTLILAGKDKIIRLKFD